MRWSEKLVCLAFLLPFTLFGQNQSLPSNIPLTAKVELTPESLAKTLDSASILSPIPISSKFFSVNSNADQASKYLVGNTFYYTWRFNSYALKARYKVKLNRTLNNDSLLILDKNGRLLETQHQRNTFQDEWLSKAWGGEIIIQYRNHSNQKPKLVIQEYSLELPKSTKKKSYDFGDSQSCEVNVNCSEGDAFQDIKRSTVRILVRSGNLAGWCTGSVINTTVFDNTPYILTAEHCGLIDVGFANETDLRRWVFFFNYESNTCNNPTSEAQVPNQAVIGAQLVARSNDQGGDLGSDFLLLELVRSIPQSYNPYFTGWNRSNQSSSSGVSIHHPEGDIKKISTYNRFLISSSFRNITPNTHWRVNWSSTANGYGVTEGGSSGSGIFNMNGLLIGTLTGGSSNCSNPTNPDLYGKFSYSWNQNGNAPENRLMDWLDPNGTGEAAIAGVDLGGQPPSDTNELAIFPNPVTTGSLALRSVGTSGESVNIQLADLAGRVVTTKQIIPLAGIDETLDVSTFRNGIYLLIIVSAGEIITRRIFITN